jgi:hypothetical protein
MEQIIPISEPKTFNSYHDSLTHHYAAPVFYDALKREISFAKREGNFVGVMKFSLPTNSSEDRLLYFANELELLVREHDLIARISTLEFVVLLRFDQEIEAACTSLITRMKIVDKREFLYKWVISDGTKRLEQVLEELDNPQFLLSTKTL